MPIWWGVELQPLNKGLQAEVYVREHGTYVGMLTYFRSLQRRGVGGGVEEEGRRPPPVICVNLLHCNPKKAAELMLSSHYQEGMKHIRDRLTGGGKDGEVDGDKREDTAMASAAMGIASPPRLINFDWHGIMSSLSEERGIEAFWHFIREPVMESGFAVGTMERKQTANGSTATSTSSSGTNLLNNITPWGDGWQMRWEQRQKGLLRFNCADSLDRTNAATCFAILPVVQEGLRLLGIPLDVSSEPAAALLQRSPLRTGLGLGMDVGMSSNGNSENERLEEEEAAEEEEEEEEVLPGGWERRLYDGRVLYIDHNSKQTQWSPPPGTRKIRSDRAHTQRAPRGTNTNTISTSNTHTQRILQRSTTPWAFFDLSLSDVRSRLYPDAIADYVTMFRKHGDIHSSLYTGSPAMHSHVLNLVLASDARPYAATASVGRLQNLRVAVQRRWNNTVSDSARQQSMELFLGLNMGRHSPGLRLVDQHSVATDLQGLDADDTLETEEDGGVEEVGRLGAQLEALHVKKHDGRVGLQEDLRNLEPVDVSAKSDEDGDEDDGDHEDVSDGDNEKEEEALDPLGVLKVSSAPSSSKSTGMVQESLI